jgi:hypothetical protein
MTHEHFKVPIPSRFDVPAQNVETLARSQSILETRRGLQILVFLRFDLQHLMLEWAGPPGQMAAELG